MRAKDLIQKFLDFFSQKGHKITPNVSLIPEHDPTVLFTTAGMHPLVSYLLGESHPLGKRLVGLQKCLRTGDIDEVGDAVHHTFFEMLGNWSLGDYFKKEAIEWSWEFLTSKDWLGIDKEKIAISVFAGDQDAPFDQESYDAWLKLGVLEERIVKLPKKNNWWGPAGETGPCGPDTEMFVWAGKSDPPKSFDPNDSNWVEVWNDVFMEYNKTKEGKFELLKQKNVDTGMGLERMLAVLNGVDDDYKTELFWPLIQKIEEISGKNYADNKAEFRIIADHLRAPVFVISDGVEPSNKQHGYVLRRLIRRSVLQLKKLGIYNLERAAIQIVEVFIDIMSPAYPELKTYQVKMIQIIEAEVKKFTTTLEKGLREFEKLTSITGKEAFDLFQTFGFPVELTAELAQEKGQQINLEEFKKEFERHQELSRTVSLGMFEGGLADQSEIVTKCHTATHLLHAALRQILGDKVFQKGSNITAERLRFDFSYPQKLTKQEISEVEKLVNQKIQENLAVKMEIMTLEEAQKGGALAFFGEKYGDKVKVFLIGDFSREVCGGPHVDFTGSLGRFKIIKEEGVAAGVRRIYAVLE